MKDTASRVFVLMVLLVGVWVLTYWLYEPGEARVTFDAADQLTLGDGAGVGVGMGEDVLDDYPPGEMIGDGDEGEMADGSTLVPPPPVAEHGEGERVAVLVPPEFKTYIVQEDDRGWEDIAAKVYGDRSLWWAVAKSNQLATSDKLIPGVTKLRYAVDPSNIQGRVEYVESPFPGVAVSPSPEPEHAAKGVEHVITERDTLWDLAKAYYGKGYLYTRILEANRGVITDENRLPIGKTIVIPPAEHE